MKARWIYPIAGVLLSLLSLVLPLMVEFTSLSKIPTSFLPSALIAITILLISQILDVRSQLSEHASKLKSDNNLLIEVVKEHLHIIKIGSPDTAIAYINSRLEDIKEVKNTSFNIEKFMPDADKNLYRTKNFEDMIKLIKLHTNKGLVWNDIGDVNSINRFRDIENSKKNSKLKHKNGGYEFKLIGHTEPQLNFIIIEYKNGDREVLFNWDFRLKIKQPTVLLSRDEKIIDMFAIHYSLLWDSGRTHIDTSII